MRNDTKKWDYIFISSNRPNPRSIEKCQTAINAGKKLALVYLERPEAHLKSNALTTCDILPFPVKFQKIQPIRLVEMFRFYQWLKNHIFPYATKNCTIYIDSALDILTVAILADQDHHKFRYAVRDLHSIQIDKSFLSFVIRNFEKFLLKRVNKLILTNEEFYRQYYRYIYTGEFCVIENYPNIDFWKNFVREKRKSVFVIGYIGIIRYMRCLKALVEATKILRKKGCNIVLKFAGGGAIEELMEFAGNPSWIEYLGPYDNNTIKEIYKDVDLSFSVYDPAVKNVRYAMPNKFYESILNGIPILVAKGTVLEKRVSEIGIGTSSDPYDANVMSDILQEAYNGEGWFVKAENALKNVDTITQAQYDKVINKAVVG